VARSRRQSSIGGTLRGSTPTGDGPERVRVLVVGELGRGHRDSWSEGEQAPIVVGQVDTFDEVVPALDELQPDVVLLASEYLRGAFRLTSCPAGVVVVGTSSALNEKPSPDPRHELNLAVLLATACP
jgi:hypothetical protein